MLHSMYVHNSILFVPLFFLHLHVVSMLPLIVLSFIVTLGTTADACFAYTWQMWETKICPRDAASVGNCKSMAAAQSFCAHLPLRLPAVCKWKIHREDGWQPACRRGSFKPVWYLVHNDARCLVLQIFCHFAYGINLLTWTFLNFTSLALRQNKFCWIRQ